jgi:hypothetical protein
MVMMSEGNLEELLAESLDCNEAWAGWWREHGHLYFGAVRPPIATTERVLPHRKGLGAETYRRRMGRRRSAGRQPALPLFHAE